MTLHDAGILRWRRFATAGFVVAVALVGCSPDDTPDTAAEPAPVEEPETDPPDPDPEPAAERPPVDEPTEVAEQTGHSTIATATQPHVKVFSAPDAEEAVHELDHPRPVGAPLTFLVDGEEGDWLEVLLPVRPNGSTGWVHRDDVALSVTGYRVEVHLSDHRLLVYDGDEVRLDEPIGVGGDGAPTPPGRYYVTELLSPPDPGGPYGPYAFGLSGFSEVHLDFAGGDGVIGIHGTNDPSSIGNDSSQGCIRLHNEVVSELATFLPLGTPVEIMA